MENMYLPTFPNIFGLKIQLLSNIFFVIVIFLILVFLLWYFVVRYRGRKKLYEQLHHFQSQTGRLERDILIQKIQTSSDTQMVVFFVEYLEKFATNRPYTSLEHLLSQHGREDEDIASMMHTLYKGALLHGKTKNKILSHPFNF